MSSIRQWLRASVPRPLQSALRPWWRKLYSLKCSVCEWGPFATWLVLQCILHRKKAVIVCRCGALGDVVCTLPLCEEIRKKHPGRLIVFVTAASYRNMVLLSNVPDLVYGGKSSWTWAFSVPIDFNVFRLVDKVYNPRTSIERSANMGSTCHLIDDLAGSCGFTVSARQPKLYPSSELIKKTRISHGLGEDIVGSRQIIAINCGGGSWPIKEWDALKWQKLIDKIHSKYEAVIILFGRTKMDGSDAYDRLTGVQSLVNRLKPEEIVALTAICHLLISIDSGPVHVAGAVGTPVVGLYGALNPRYYLPPSAPAMAVFSDVPCRFCNHITPVGHWITGCPNNTSCMKQLGQDIVFDAVKSMLANNKKQEAANTITVSA